MIHKVYFDTDCFHHFATTFADTLLPVNLRENILLSPITMMEVLSHLARNWGVDVHKQIRSMKNWLSPDHVMVLPFMDAAISIIGFGAKVTDDEYTGKLQADINTCIDAEFCELREVAEARDAEIQKIKKEYAVAFQRDVICFRGAKLNKETFTKLWLRRFRNNSEANLHLKADEEIVATFSALREYEYERLKVAIANKNYNAMNHVNDLFDAEQLIYLGDATLNFLTIDKGYLKKVKTSPQRDRIHQVSGSEVDDFKRAEALLRGLIT